jgi:pilus assembly protein Flp/PilA
MLQQIKKICSEKGQGIVEYALILAFVVAIAAVALSSNSGMGQAIQAKFTAVTQALTGTGGGGGNP